MLSSSHLSSALPNFRHTIFQQQLQRFIFKKCRFLWCQQWPTVEEIHSRNCKRLLVVSSNKLLQNSSFYCMAGRMSEYAWPVQRQHLQKRVLSKIRNYFILCHNIYKSSRMAQDIHSKLKNNMSYGTVTRNELPGDIEDYTISLIKQYHQNSPPTLKLKFTRAKNEGSSSTNFYVKIDDVREPANPLVLIKYSEQQKKISAKASRIKKKMILSVEKQIKEHQDLVEQQSQEEDSDIPRGRPMFQQFSFEGDQVQIKPHKRARQNGQGEDDSSS